MTVLTNKCNSQYTLQYLSNPSSQNDVTDNQEFLLEEFIHPILTNASTEPYLAAAEIVDIAKKLNYEFPIVNVGAGQSKNADAESVRLNGRMLLRELSLTDDNHQHYSLMAERKELVATKFERMPYLSVLDDFLSKLHGDYQKHFADITAAATKYMEKFNTMLGAISTYLDSSNTKDGKIKFDYEKFRDNELGQFLDDVLFSRKEPVKLKPIFTLPKADEKTCEFWQKKLGDGYVVKLEQNGEMTVTPNLDPLYKAWDLMFNNKGEMSTQVFQALQTGLDSHKNIVNNDVSRLLEKFRQDNGHIETLIQLLTQLVKDAYQYNMNYMNM